MSGRRTSARIASQPKSSPTQSKESPTATAGSKRKSESGASPTPKRGRKASNKKEQRTIEDTMDLDQSTNANENATQNDSGDSKKSEHKDQPEESKKSQKTEEQPQATSEATEAKSVETNGHAKAEQAPTLNGHKAEDDNKAEEEPAQDASKMDDTGKVERKNSSEEKSKQNEKSSTNDENAIEPHARDEETPSSILEKGVIYFFFRGRVGIDNPSQVDDIARSYIVLRPIPHGAKIGEGTIGDGNGKCRLLALPKKVLPLSGKDKFMTFVEKSRTTFKELRDDFMSASDYETQTAGTRHTPAVTPVAEGVYAITTTGRESHLAYMITIPQELGEVQKDMGIREQGSFITSAKNPKYAGPANTNLPQGPDFPQEIIDEFRSLRWMPLQPKLLDYENTQFLLIGESSGIDGATDQAPEDKKDGEIDPKEELEKLEGEDEIRIRDLNGDDAVFADLGISKKEYSQIPSTWSD